jgi:aspartyl-tRNA(Asn)/glutamyl-tRNA(Gln) amidotransferase subunit B
VRYHRVRCFTAQFDVPVCHDGFLDVTVDHEVHRIRIERAHMEEDTGKSTHIGVTGRIHAAESTLLDFNRSGVPLVEIVSRPDIGSAPEARAYAQELRAIVAELDVSDARLEEGSIRFDANVSVRPEGSDTLGTKVEVKNMNSFRSLERAIAYEIERQVGVLETEGELIQETRHWDEQEGVTHSMRTKEGSSDYRYFTEPDLVPMAMSEDWVEEVRSELPELPASRRARLEEQGLDGALASVLTAAPAELRSIYFEAVSDGAPPKAVANWLVGEVTAWLRRSETEPADLSLTGPHLSELIAMVDDGTVSSSAAKEVLEGVLAGEGPPRAVAESRDLVQIQDTGALEEAVVAVLKENPDAVVSYRGGEEKVVGFLVGQVMRATQGKADPKLVNDMLREKLKA